MYQIFARLRQGKARTVTYVGSYATQDFSLGLDLWMSALWPGHVSVMWRRWIYATFIGELKLDTVMHILCSS